jgi:hypothetical protein
MARQVQLHLAELLVVRIDQGEVSPAGDELPEEVRRLADAGEQLRAVARLRGLSGVGIEEAMRRVEAYLAGQDRRTRRCRCND